MGAKTSRTDAEIEMGGAILTIEVSPGQISNLGYSNGQDSQKDFSDVTGMVGEAINEVASQVAEINRLVWL